VDLPEPDGRREIVVIHLRKRGRSPENFDLDAIVQSTQDFTGSEIEKVIRGALRRAFADGEREVTTEDLLAVAGETVPLVTTMADGVARMREWAKRARPASSRQDSGHQVSTTRRALEIS